MADYPTLSETQSIKHVYSLVSASEFLATYGGNTTELWTPVNGDTNPVHHPIVSQEGGYIRSKGTASSASITMSGMMTTKYIPITLGTPLLESTAKVTFHLKQAFNQVGGASGYSYWGLGIAPYHRYNVGYGYGITPGIEAFFCGTGECGAYALTDKPSEPASVDFWTYNTPIAFRTSPTASISMTSENVFEIQMLASVLNQATPSARIRLAYYVNGVMVCRSSLTQTIVTTAGVPSYGIFPYCCHYHGNSANPCGLDIVGVWVE